MHKQESSLKNDMHKSPCYLEIRANYLIPDRKPNPIYQEKTCYIMDFAVPTEESENKTAKR